MQTPIYTPEFMEPIWLYTALPKHTAQRPSQDLHHWLTNAESSLLDL